MRDLFCHILVEKADDIPDCWTGLCLELDVMSQGHSIGDAINMVIEATMLIVSDGDIFTADELEARRAPEEYWETYMRIDKLLAAGNQSDAFFCATTTIQLAETQEEQEVLRVEIDKLLAENVETQPI